MIKQAKPAAEAKQQARISVARCARLVLKFVGYLGLRSAPRGFALLHPRLISIARLRRSRCAKIWVMTRREPPGFILPQAPPAEVDTYSTSESQTDDAHIARFF